jgi:hypothetical protein
VKSGNTFRPAILLGICAFLLAGFFAMRNLASWPARISYPGEESYEGCALVETARLAEGVPIYAAPSAGGFAGATYGPLYYLMGSRLIDPKNPSYLPLRLLSALSILGCAAGCAVLAFWLTRSWFAACLSPLVFLAYGIVTYHGVSALSDNVALFLSFAGFLIAYRFRNTRAILFAVPLMILGFYYKQQFVAGSLAVLLYLLLERRYARAAQFAGLMAACGIGLFALFQWVIFRGQEFWRHFLFYQSTLFSWHQWELGLLAFALILGIPILLSLEFLRESPDRLIRCYVVCAVLLGIITIGKATAFLQYFYESVLLVGVLVPALLAKRIAQGTRIIEVLVLFAICLLAAQWYTPPAPTASDRAQYERVESLLRNGFHSREPALGFRGGDLVQAGLDTPFADLFQTELLARRGIISDRDLVNQIREQRFGVILLDFDLRTERDPLVLNYYLNTMTRDAIERNYRVASTIAVPELEKSGGGGQFYVYVPAQRSTL